MKTSATFSSLLFPFLCLQSFVPSVDAAAWIDNIVQCGMSFGMEMCAIRLDTTPSPGTIQYPNGTEATKYTGGYSTTFTFVDGYANGTQFHDDGNYTDGNYTGLEIYVMRNDDNSCTTEVNLFGTLFNCSSCHFCGTGDYNYEIDCTDIDEIMFTKPITCDNSILPIFFPLDEVTMPSHKEAPITSSNTAPTTTNGEVLSSSTYSYALSGFVWMALTAFHFVHTGN